MILRESLEICTMVFTLVSSWRSAILQPWTCYRLAIQNRFRWRNPGLSVSWESQQNSLVTVCSDRYVNSAFRYYSPINYALLSKLICPNLHLRFWDPTRTGKLAANSPAYFPQHYWGSDLPIGSLFGSGPRHKQIKRYVCRGTEVLRLQPFSFRLRFWAN